MERDTEAETIADGLKPHAASFLMDVDSGIRWHNASPSTYRSVSSLAQLVRDRPALGRDFVYISITSLGRRVATVLRARADETPGI